jgi:hypothetical protein
MTAARSLSQFRWRCDMIRTLVALYLHYAGSETLTVAACHNLLSSRGDSAACGTLKF